MMRRTFLVAAALAPMSLSACQYGYDVGELAGHYRAAGSRIAETLALFPDLTYAHSWVSEVGRVQHEAVWRLEGNWIYFDGYTAPGDLVGKETFFIPGPPTWFSDKPTFFSYELDLNFVKVRNLEANELSAP